MLMNDTITQLRKELHRYPELSGKEHRTAARIKTFLSTLRPDDIWEQVGGTGILAFFKAEEQARKTILFRSELDALPIQEVNTFEHASDTAGVAHKCGHDGHMSIMCALAQKLQQDTMKYTDVLLLFQPAEENGAGAVAVFNDPRFQKLNIDFVFALHNLPGFPLHQIVVKDNTFTCAVNSIIIKLYGKTAHAGEPENGDNPALAIAALIQAFDALIQPDLTKENFTLLTPVYLDMGTRDYGISAGYGEVHYTFRRAGNAQMQALELQLEKLAVRTAAQFNLKPEISWTQKFSANENNPEAVDIVRVAARNKDTDLSERAVPFKWGEDFGIFTEHYKGAMFGLGSGENTPALHNPDYDFPDEITPTGAGVFYEICKLVDHAQ